MSNLSKRVEKLEMVEVGRSFLWVDRTEDGLYLDAYGMPHDSVDDVIKMNGLAPDRTTAICWESGHIFNHQEKLQ